MMKTAGSRTGCWRGPRQCCPIRRVARNEPYRPDDGVTHSLKLHAFKRGLATVMIEVRNDLLREPGRIAGIAREILTLLKPALEEIKRREDGS